MGARKVLGASLAISLSIWGNTRLNSGSRRARRTRDKW